MAVPTVLFWVFLILSAVGSNGSGELRVLHSPNSLGFSGSTAVLESSLKEIFSASLGLSVEENSNWNGLQINDPFNSPEAAVEVYVDGIASLGDAAGLNGQLFPLMVDEYEPDTFFAVEHRIKQRNNNGGNNLVNIKLSNPKQLMDYSDIFGDIKVPMPSKQTYDHLKSTVDEDRQFLQELEALKAITEKLKSGIIKPDNIVDFYSFRFTSLHPLSDYHGPTSVQTIEAKKLLGAALEEFSKAFVKAYDGSALVTVVTTDVAHTRRHVRSVRDTDANLGPSDGASAEFAAIFNIILWFVVVFSFSLIAIVYTMMDMDPGRDSIIYRMTSTRIKKDN